MNLSRIMIDTKKYSTMKALYNTEILHGMIESSFDGDRQRNLWRIDHLSGNDYLLLLSHEPPSNNFLPKQIGKEGTQWEIKAYDVLLSKIIKGSKWFFKITANPTKSVFVGEKKRGKIKAITVIEEQRKWLMRQGEKNGFEVIKNQFDVIQSDWKRFVKNNREVSILAVTFEGILTVTDTDSFKRVLVEGIGREKAYGMGLLTVIPYER